jgi:cyclin H
MDFNRSTQARSWLFDEDSIAACRERAAVEASANINEPRVRKFASGFHSRFSKEREGSPTVSELPRSTFPTLSPNDKETLVRFHAHQIQALVGPTAILSELCTTETVLSSAIMFFRRFYLSNCILDINPRKMAAACAFFAAKAEEERIDVSSPHGLMVECVGRSVQKLLSCEQYAIFLS